MGGSAATARASSAMRTPCCDSCSTVVSLPVPTFAQQKKRANALHIEERVMTNNDDGSYGLLSRPLFEDPLGVNQKRLG